MECVGYDNVVYREMTKTVEFLYDFVSAPSYLAWMQMEAIAGEANADLTMTPVFCAGIFNAIGNPGPLAVPAKREWYGRDLTLCAKKQGIPYNSNPNSPIRTLPLMRGAFVAQERGEIDHYVKTVFEAIFVEVKNMNDVDVVRATLNEAGIDFEAYWKGIERDDVKMRLRVNTENAVKRGVFGVPTFFVGDELFFGQDSLEFVRDALRAL
jgi:2-hydroxychromene-2-carboxylate isomerase